MPIVVPIRTVIQYASAALVPIAIGALEPWTRTIYPFPASVFFLCIVASARFYGFGPALLCTLVSTFALWNTISAVPGPLQLQIVRVMVFFAAALVIASIALQKSKEVSAAEERLKPLFDAAIDAILFVDADARYVDANPAAAALLGYSREEIIGRKIGDFTPPGKRHEATELFRKGVKDGRISGEWPVLLKDGSAAEVQFRAVGNVRPGIYFIMLHDITRRKDAERALQGISGRLLQLQDEERRRIARQLHDTTAQSLGAIRLNLLRIGGSPLASSGAMKQAVDESVALTDQAIAEIRTLSYLLHPPMIDEAGLLTSLRWLVRGFEQRSGIQTTFDAPQEIGRLSPEVATVVLRVVQEALTNIQRHSGSAVATIRLQRDAQRLQLEVQDEGHGMPQELRDSPKAPFASGVGIAGIQERVRELDGQTDIESGDRGTRVLVTLPVPEA